MRILKRLGIGILLVVLLLIIVSFFLPSKVHVERSLDMKTKPEHVFALVNNLENWNQWSPWYKRDSSMQITYGERSAGEGASYAWKSNHPKVGEGSLYITQSKPYDLVETEMHFGDMGISKGHFTFVPVAEGVKVTWSMDSEGKGISWMMYVPSKYVNLFMDQVVGPDFEEGLSNLRTITEAIPEKETVAGFDVEEKMIDKIMILSIRETVNNKEIGLKLGRAYAMIGQYIGKAGIKETASPLAIWHRYGADESDMEAAVPVEGPVKGYRKIMYNELPATHAYVVKYYGSYGGTAAVYEAAQQYIEAKGKQATGAAREVYVTDPGMEKDTAKWLTELIFPVNEQ